MEEFEIVYRDNYDKVFYFLLSLTKNHILAEELTSQTFYKAFINIKKFKGNSKIIVWLCQIGKNEYYTYLKKNKSIKELDDDILDEKQNTLSYLLIQENKIEIHNLIHDLEEPFKEIIMLRVFGELNNYEIAKIFNQSENWVRVNYFRAKKKIRELYKEKYEKRM